MPDLEVEKYQCTICDTKALTANGAFAAAADLIDQRLGPRRRRKRSLPTPPPPKTQKNTTRPLLRQGCDARAHREAPASQPQRLNKRDGGA